MSSLLNDIDSTINNGLNAIKSHVEKFLEENYYGEFKISDKPNKYGLFEVDGLTNIRVKNTSILSLTNDLFVWNEVNGYFSCGYCKSLKSLKGAPEKVNYSFDCSFCNSLKDLEGAPEKVNHDFICSFCKSLESLKGAPEKVNHDFVCLYCKSLKSLECAPKIIEGGFYCYDCGVEFTKNDVKKVSTVKMEIYY